MALIHVDRIIPEPSGARSSSAIRFTSGSSLSTSLSEARRYGSDCRSNQVLEVDVLTLCPRCHRAVDNRIFGVSTGLGPPLVRCPKCATEFRTERKEWAQFSNGEVARFALLTVLYFVGCAVTGAAVHQLLYCTMFFGRCNGVGVDHWTLGNAGPGGALFGVLVLATQLHRVRCSHARVAAPAPVVVVPSRWDLQLSVQNKFRAVFICLCILAMLMLFAHVIFG